LVELTIVPHRSGTANHFEKDYCMASADAEMTKMVRSQIARRSIDASMLNIRCSHGIVYLVGVIKTLRTHPELDLQKEMEHISAGLRSKPGIREIVWDVTQRT